MRYFITVIVLTTFLMSCKDTKKERIRVAVESQLSMYPKSTLQDLHKYFFQDYFGPGRIIGEIFIDNIT